MKEMVENFNQNMNMIKATMSSRHEREKKVFLKSIKKNPSRKYASMAALTEDLYLTTQSEKPEADC